MQHLEALPIARKDMREKGGILKEEKKEDRQRGIYLRSSGGATRGYKQRW